MGLRELSNLAAAFTVSQWGVSLPRESVRRLPYKPPLTKFLEDNGAKDPLDIQGFLWLNQTTAFTLEAGTLVKIITD